MFGFGKRLKRDIEKNEKEVVRVVKKDFKKEICYRSICPLRTEEPLEKEGEWTLSIWSINPLREERMAKREDRFIEFLLQELKENSCFIIEDIQGGYEIKLR